MPKGMVLLIIAICSEIVATTSLKLSEGFTRVFPSVATVIGYGLALYLLSLSLKHQIPLGVAYAVWSGLGTAGIVLVGVLIWREPLNIWRVIGIVLIIAGVIIVSPRHAAG
jgi:multidrug transporter EmrE-like cation transporter